MKRTSKRTMEYKVKDIAYTVSKDNLAEGTETTVIDVEVLEVPETIKEIVEVTNEETLEVTEEIQNNNKEGNTMKVNFEEILEETAKETAEEMKGEDNMKDSTKKIEEATNDAKEKVSEAMASIGKYVDEFKINANKIAKMSDKQAYEYVMDRIDAHILMFGNWSGDHFTAIKETLEQQRSKINKAVKKAEDAVDESDFDDETKTSLFQEIKAFLGQVIKSVFIVTKAAVKFSLKVAGIVTTLGYRVIRGTITETISAGKAIGYAANDACKEIKEGFSKDEYNTEEEYYDNLAKEYEEFTVNVETVEA